MESRTRLDSEHFSMHPPPSAPSLTVPHSSRFWPSVLVFFVRDIACIYSEDGGWGVSSSHELCLFPLSVLFVVVVIVVVRAACGRCCRCSLLLLLLLLLLVLMHINALHLSCFFRVVLYPSFAASFVSANLNLAFAACTHIHACFVAVPAITFHCTPFWRCSCWATRR